MSPPNEALLMDLTRVWGTVKRHPFFSKIYLSRLLHGRRDIHARLWQSRFYWSLDSKGLPSKWKLDSWRRTTQFASRLRGVINSWCRWGLTLLHTSRLGHSPIPYNNLPSTCPNSLGHNSLHLLDLHSWLDILVSSLLKGLVRSIIGMQ